MTIFLTLIHVIVCFILILVILLQAGRGQGLTGGGFGSGNVQSLFGTRAADFLTKATSVAAICFLFTCIGLNVLETQRSRSLFDTRRQSAPVDMETIKKALEKVKAQKGSHPQTAGPAAAPAPPLGNASQASNQNPAGASTKAASPEKPAPK